MKKLLARLVRQSPAMVVAMLALFVALTGTAVATTSALITGKQIKNSSITGLDVKNKSLTPKDFKGSVRGPRGLTGATGATGAAGAKGDKGDKGDTGAPGSATAYGYLDWNGASLSFDASRSKNVVEVQRQGVGIYCVKLAVDPKNAIASGVRDAGSSNAIVETKVPPNSNSCEGVFSPDHKLQIVITIPGTGLADHDVMFNVN